MKLPELAPLRAHLLETVIGSEETVDLLLTAILAGGHVLLEGAPGVGKTTLAHTLANSVGGSFKRVQFTPDLLPSDLLGYNLYRPNSGEFEFIKGPVFANCLLADEINRTSPRVQSALLESMNEGRTTIDGVTHDLPKPFLVIATQNATHTTGTFPLPEPQLDRFLVSMEMGLPDVGQQIEILMMQAGGDVAAESCEPLLVLEDVEGLQKRVLGVTVAPAVAAYITDLCEGLRDLAGSPESVSIRASIALLRAAQAKALLAGVSAVYPEHVQAVLRPVMRHRIFSEQGLHAEDLIERVRTSTAFA